MWCVCTIMHIFNETNQRNHTDIINHHQKEFPHLKKMLTNDLFVTADMLNIE